MLAQESYAAIWRCHFVIVDELHSFAGNKRGADLTLSLDVERLRLGRTARCAVRGLAARCPYHADGTEVRFQQESGRICRIGLSATAAPLDVLAKFLVGEGVNAGCGSADEKKSLVKFFRRSGGSRSAGGIHRRAALRRAGELIRTGNRCCLYQCPLGAEQWDAVEELSDLADQIEIHHASLDRSVSAGGEDR